MPNLLTTVADARSQAGSSAGEVLRALFGEMAVQRARGLADFDQGAVRVSHVAREPRADHAKRRLLREHSPFSGPAAVAGRPRKTTGNPGVTGSARSANSMIRLFRDRAIWRTILAMLHASPGVAPRQLRRVQAGIVTSTAFSPASGGRPVPTTAE